MDEDDRLEALRLRIHNAAYDFGLACREAAEAGYWGLSAIDDGVNFLMTELWDQNFSQTEIRAAFNAALADMNRYAAGSERRSDEGADNRK